MDRDNGKRYVISSVLTSNIEAWGLSSFTGYIYWFRLGAAGLNGQSPTCIYFFPSNCLFRSEILIKDRITVLSVDVVG